MAGRKPKPTAVRVAEGNPGKRPLNTAEPKPRAKNPKMPAYLSPAARVEWRRVLRILAPTGLITEAEADLVALYATTCALWQEEFRAVFGPRVDAKGLPQLDAEGKPLQPEGTIVFSGNWTPMRNPRLKTIEDAQKTMSRCMTELGLTPSARARLVAPSNEGDALDDMMRMVQQRTKAMAGNE